MATARYEMLREGLQECEARIVIEQALVAGKLGPQLAERCTALLKDRLRARLKDGRFHQYGYKEDTEDYQHRIWGLPVDWQASTEALFTLAAEAAASLAQ